jgi:glyoxylase-like metal-dependent hydrolase (beta-lactamase superfamily II)
VAALAALAFTVHAEPPGQPVWTTDFAKVEESVTDLGHGIYVLSPNIRPLAGNTTVAVGTDGLIVVDTQFPQLYGKLRDKISGISPLPVKFVINTHHHADHAGGNEAFGKAGAVIIAEEHAVGHLVHPPKRADGTSAAPMPAVGLPAITYDGGGIVVRIESQTARLSRTTVPAHTDDDTIVVFPEANVIATGDVFNSLLYPHIDATVGGSIDGMIAAVDQISALANDQTRIVPGHGPVSDKRGLAAYRAMLVTARDRISKAKADGMSEKQVMDANLLKDLNDRWLLPGSPVAETFPAIVYRALK